MRSDNKNNIDPFDVRNFFKRWPKVYFFIATIFGPMMFCGLSALGFLRRFPSDGKTLNLGSGPRVIREDVINVDFYPYKGVSLVADVLAIPLPDNSVARIISDNVLEHVKDPTLAVKEMYRLLASGGHLYVSTPFMYPFHSSPHDFQRWTTEGLRELLCDFEVIEIGVRAGPFSALTVFLNHLFATIFSFGSVRLYGLLLNLVMFLTFPIKLLDLIFNHWPKVDTVAAVLYCVVRKK